jgi:hypothetical protein
MAEQQKGETMRSSRSPRFEEWPEEEQRVHAARREALSSRLFMTASRRPGPPAVGGGGEMVLVEGTASGSTRSGLPKMFIPKLNLGKLSKRATQELVPKRPLPFSLRTKQPGVVSLPADLTYVGVGAPRPPSTARSASLKPASVRTRRALTGRLTSEGGAPPLVGRGGWGMGGVEEGKSRSGGGGAAAGGSGVRHLLARRGSAASVAARINLEDLPPTFMEVLERDPQFHMSHLEGTSFVYLEMRGNCVYDLIIADPARVDPTSCITLSAAGITFARKTEGAEAEFLTLDEYEREYFLYHTILKLPFFRKYRM